MDNLIYTGLKLLYRRREKKMKETEIWTKERQFWTQTKKQTTKIARKGLVLPPQQIPVQILKFLRTKTQIICSKIILSRPHLASPFVFPAFAVQSVPLSLNHPV